LANDQNDAIGPRTAIANGPVLRRIIYPQADYVALPSTTSASNN